MWTALAFIATVILVGENLILYAAPVVGLVVGSRLVRRRTAVDVVVGVCAMALGFLPFAYWGYLYLRELDFPERRAAEIASWPRRPVTAETKPDTIVVLGDSYAAPFLVAAGVFKVSYGKPFISRRDWSVYRRKDSPQCPVAIIADMSSRAMKKAIADCVESEKVEGPPAHGSYLILSQGDEAPSAIKWVTWGKPWGSPIELRWSPDEGGVLIDFWEYTNFTALTIPPSLVFARFNREAHPSRTTPRPLEFAAKAVGWPVEANEPE